MKTYYAATAEIRYYRAVVDSLSISEDYVYGIWKGKRVDSSLRTWKEPPHVHLANMVVTAKSVAELVKRFGLPVMHHPKFRNTSDKKEFDWGSSVSDDGHFCITCSDIRCCQRFLRVLWKSDGKHTQHPNKAADLPMPWDMEAWVKRTGSGIEIMAEDLWQFACLLLASDRVAGRTAVCPNDGCPAPYFLVRRKGQTYCSHKCAVLISVRRFRELQAKKKGD